MNEQVLQDSHRIPFNLNRMGTEQTEQTEYIQEGYSNLSDSQLPETDQAPVAELNQENSTRWRSPEVNNGVDSDRAATQTIPSLPNLSPSNLNRRNQIIPLNGGRRAGSPVNRGTPNRRLVNQQREIRPYPLADQMSEFSNGNFPSRFATSLSQLSSMSVLTENDWDQLEINLNKFKQKVAVVAHFKVQYFYSRLSVVLLNLIGMILAFYLISGSRNSKLQSLNSATPPNFENDDFTIIRYLMLFCSILEIFIIVILRSYQLKHEDHLEKLESKPNEVKRSKLWTTSYFLDSSGKFLSFALFWLSSYNLSIPYVASIGPFALSSLIIIIFQILGKNKTFKKRNPQPTEEDDNVSLPF